MKKCLICGKPINLLPRRKNVGSGNEQAQCVYCGTWLHEQHWRAT